MELGPWFWNTIQFGLAVFALYGVLIVVAWTLQILPAAKRALDRYAVRKEVVVEEYDPKTMMNLRIYERPTPYRVYLAKQGRRLYDK